VKFSPLHRAARGSRGFLFHPLVVPYVKTYIKADLNENVRPRARRRCGFLGHLDRRIRDYR